MKIKNTFLILLTIFICGCASWSPYYSRYQELDNAYNLGQITYAEYMNLKIQTQNQETQWTRDAFSPRQISDFEKQQNQDLQRARSESLKIMRGY